MDQREAIKLLKQKLVELACLRGLPCDDDSDNEKFKLWRLGVLDIIEARFDKDSSEYKRMPTMPIKTLTFPRTDAERQQEYNGYLDRYETCLKSIIQKYETLGIKKTPVANNKKSIYQKIWYEVKDFIATIIAKFAAEKTK